MTTADIYGLLASYVYATGLILAAEGLRRWFAVPRELTRKLVHIGAGSVRSWEGSAAMFLASLAAITLTLALLPGSWLSPQAPSLGIGRVVAAALLAAGVATLVEAVSPRGLDNLGVPLVAAGVVLAALQV